MEETAENTKSNRIWRRLEGQGYPRFLALMCIHPSHLPLPEELDESSDDALSLSVLRHLEARYAETMEEAKRLPKRESRDWIAMSASGLLVYGRLDMVEVILDKLPRQRYQTDHYAGQCYLLPYFAISHTLPIPESICSCSKAAGRIDRQAAIAWFHTNRDRLVWSDDQRQFVFAVI